MCSIGTLSTHNRSHWRYPPSPIYHTVHTQSTSATQSTMLKTLWSKIWTFTYIHTHIHIHAYIYIQFTLYNLVASLNHDFFTWLLLYSTGVNIYAFNVDHKAYTYFSKSISFQLGWFCFFGWVIYRLSSDNTSVLVEFLLSILCL